LEGKQNPDRDAQFRYLNERAKNHQADGQPVVSVDTKKKERIGEYKTRAASGTPRATRPKLGLTTSPTRSGAKPCPTESTTWSPTPAGSTSAPITTPPPSPWNPCAAGGPEPAAPITHERPGC
jgi:hypothetical protein